MSKLKKDMNENQTDFIKLLIQSEDGPSRGGTVTTAIKAYQMKQAMIAHLLNRKAKNEKDGIAKENTLLVVPKDDIANWKKLLAELLKEGALRVYYFYKDNTTNECEVLAENDIVVAAYDTMKTNSHFPLFQKVQWKRIVLHDSFLIQNTETKRFRTICQLEADYRWCLTCNPGQLSLVYFLLRDIEKRLQEAEVRFPLDEKREMVVDKWEDDE